MTKERDEELLLTKERLEMVLQGSDLGFWDWDIEKNNVTRNDRWAQILGYSSIEEFDDSTDAWTDSIHPDDRDVAWKSISDHLNGLTDSHRMEYRMLTKDGGYVWILDQAKIVQRDQNGKPLRMSGTHLDITHRKNMEAKLENLASHDSLTGLYNRQVIMDRLNYEVDRACRYSNSLSVFMLDIDHFKFINDTYGHLNGDAVLRDLAKLINNTIRKTDYAGRFGGEEFLILLPETNTAKALELAQRLCNIIKESDFLLDNDQTIRVTASIGVASLTDEAKAAEDLVKQADSAMYAAKKAGRNQVKTF